jgi:putative membrane protein
MLRWILASLHLLAFGIGLGAIWARAMSLSSPSDAGSVRRALNADAWWGVAALVWLATGVPRVLLGSEKPTSYYLSNHVFWLKMALFGAILVLELGPIVALGRWRRAVRAGQGVDTSSAPRLATISRVQVGLLLGMLLAATAMARGLGPS